MAIQYSATHRNNSLADITTQGLAQILESLDLAFGISRFAGGEIVTPSSSQFYSATVVVQSQTAGWQPAVPTFPEQSAIVVAISFTDVNSNPWTPVTLAYQVDDVGSGLNLVPLTPTTPGPSVSITLTAGQNDMVSNSRDSEIHRVIFKFTDTKGQSYFADAIFYITRLFPVAY